MPSSQMVWMGLMDVRLNLRADGSEASDMTRRSPPTLAWVGGGMKAGAAGVAGAGLLSVGAAGTLVDLAEPPAGPAARSVAENP